MAVSVQIFCLLWLLYGQCHGALKLASIYGDHMVLQRGPQRAVVWGTASKEGDTVTARVTGQGSPATTTVKGGTWKLKLPAITAPGPFVITFSSSEGTATLNDVLFGDVWLCSGQSNMEFNFNNINGAAQEMQKVLALKTIRMMKVSHVTANTPQTTVNLDLPWTPPSSAAFSSFSAVCLLFAEYLQPYINRPIGLVESNWGGTPIEAWSPQEAINGCPPVHHTYVQTCCPQTPKALYNGMISPILDQTIFGALWYQGEGNADIPEQYKCQMIQLVKQWRQKFNAGSLGETALDFPFGYVQLAPYHDDHQIGGWPPLRWAQTADHGYSPNPDLPRTFMAVAMDLPDFTSPFDPIHPRYKIEVGQRLALGARNVAYGQSSVSFQGPFPTGFVSNAAMHTLRVEYDNGRANLDIRATTGFEVCCSQNAMQCGNGDQWVAAPISGHDTSHVTLSTTGCGTRHVVGMRYAWLTSPCPLKKCAIYAVGTELPGPPYITYKLN